MQQILIVDDTPANLRLAEYLLTRAGYRVRTAADATDALAVLAAVTPSLILMDLQLPGVDGFSLTAQLRRDPAMNAVPIVAMTAYAMPGDATRARAAGCDDYLSKPIDTHAFVDNIRGFIARGVRAASDAAASHHP